MTLARQDRSAGLPGTWRERWRFLAATLAVTLLYLALQEVWLWAALQLGRSGWTYDDPAKTYAAEAATVAAQSKAREAALSPQHPHAVLELGVWYGYLSQWLGGYGAQPEATMRELEHPVEHVIRRMNTLAEALEIGLVERLPVHTAADFGQLTQRLEDDAGGVASRVEQATSLRLRHLFMLGVHVGTELAALESATDVMPIPATKLIGKHGTLAGVPEPVWRPIARLPEGERTAALARYREAIGALEKSVAGATTSPTS